MASVGFRPILQSQSCECIELRPLVQFVPFKMRFLTAMARLGTRAHIWKRVTCSPLVSVRFPSASPTAHCPRIPRAALGRPPGAQK